MTEWALPDALRLETREPGTLLLTDRGLCSRKWFPESVRKTIERLPPHWLFLKLGEPLATVFTGYALLGFIPYEGDWLDIEYSLQRGSSKITIHSLKATKCMRLQEVCVTSIHKQQGVLNHTIFFTFHSLKCPMGYTPLVGHVVNVVVVQSIRPNYNWRAISMMPVNKL
ncbi:cancer/testis antigen 55-like [Onychomys torridus]|uniref:cancer/testis antigen 55-like n=1 Tax=Onychomys torridus TaxID=38674 RepID=UPI00167F6C8A|nr:cancer/testis antigen 55-like [Onychomys torridus]